VPHRSAQWTDSFSGEQKRQMNVRRGCASNRSSGKFQLAVTVMSSFFKCLIAVCIFSVVAGMATEPPGFVEGHLKIISGKEVELADGNAPVITAENYAQYPLIRARAEKKNSRVLLQTGMETIALHCRRAIMSWMCNDARAVMFARNHNDSRLFRTRLSASTWISTRVSASLVLYAAVQRCYSVWRESLRALCTFGQRCAAEPA